jgi:hypothetical protein
MLELILTWLESSSPATKLVLGLVICGISTIGFITNGRRAFYRRKYGFDTLFNRGIH